MGRGVCLVSLSLGHNNENSFKGESFMTKEEAQELAKRAIETRRKYGLPLKKKPKTNK